jgi:hypothetical protein
MARVTLPERRQRVQALIRCGEPFTTALTRFTLGFHVLFERLCEWETLIPKVTALPQISHFAILLHLLKNTQILLLNELIITECLANCKHYFFSKFPK